MIFSNWLQLLPHRIKALRKSSSRRENWNESWRPADSRTDQSIERLETRLYLSGLTSYSTASSDWFGVVDASFSSQTGLSGSSSSSGSANDGADVRRFLVRLTPEATAQAGSLAGVQELISDNDVELVVTDGLGLPGQVIVSTTERDSVQVVQSLSGNDAVAYFEEDFSVGATTTRFPNENGISAEFSRQYGLNNTGQTGGLTDADINAPEAWDVTIGSVETVVSVIDSGVDYTHPDLYLNIWLNQGELPPQFTPIDTADRLEDIDNDGLITFRDLNDAANSSFVTDLNGNGYIDASDLLKDPKWADGIDTDGNGFEDDLVGWDFFENDNKPFDEHRHGTHVAGILGAVGDNADPDNADPDKRFDGGVSGVNWQTSIMPLRFLDEDNRGDVSSAVEAINYTTMMRTRAENQVNVRVSNNSWGASGAFSQTLFDAVAGNEQADILFVAAAGNGDVLGQGVNNDDVAFFPANLALGNVISVAALNDRGELASFSNFGTTTVDIAAPGVGIVSTDLGRSFIARSGTSMATPFVAGTAALVFDEFPEATAAEVREAILKGATNNPSFADKIAGNLDVSGQTTGGRSLNALGALTASTFAPVPELVTVPGISGSDAGVVITVTYDDPNTNDAFRVDSTTFDIRDVQLTRDGFLETLLAPVSISNTTMMGGLPTVEYQFDAPGGTWDATENGTWRVSLREGEIRDDRDSNPLFSAPRELGTFTVSIADPNVIFVNSTIDSVDIDPMDGRADDGGTTVDGQPRVSLRAAIMHANQIGAPTTIVVPDGTYVLTRPGANEGGAATGDLDLTSSHGITVIGGGAFQTVIDGQQLDRVFDVPAGASATLIGLTVQNGRSSQGGGINNLGTLTVDGVLVRDNQAETAGGGIFSSGMLSVLNSSVEDNQVASQFFAIGGGGLAINGDPANASHQTTITDSSFAGNTSSLSGGGLLAVDTTLTLQGVTLAENVAAGGNGGGLLIRHSTSDRQSTLDRVTITDNSAGTVARGGGLFIDAPLDAVTLQNTVLAGNTAGFDAELSGQFLSDGTNLISQLSTDGLNLRRLVSGAADFDQIGTPQSPLTPDLSALERPDGLVQQVRNPEGNGLASNEDLTGLADLSLTPGLTITYSTGELEPNNSRGQAMRLDDRGWSLEENADIANSTTIPHVTITGTGDGTFDFYSFTVEQAGSTAVFDIDNGAITPSQDFNTELFLFDSQGNLLASNDDAALDAGSQNGEDARIEHTFGAAGYYTVAVGAFGSDADGSDGLTGTAPAEGQRYVLHVSVQGHELAPTTYNPTSAAATLFPIAGAANREGFVFSASEGTALFEGLRRFPVQHFQGLAAVGDLDRDGSMDVVIGSSFAAQSSVVLNNGDVTFALNDTIDLGNTLQHLVLGDVNRDGLLDIVTANGFTQNVGVLTGKGDGTFNAKQDFPAGGRPYSVVLGDVNGDGFADIVTANGLTQNVSVLTGNGDGTFSAAESHSVGSTPYSVVLGDVNGDGFQDIVTGNTGFDANNVSVLAGNGDGTFDGQQLIPTGNRPVVSVVIGDVNGDGSNDIVTVNSGGTDAASVSVLVGNGAGSFAPVDQDVPVRNDPFDIALGDINGDGFDDLLTAHENSGNVSVLTGNGDGKFDSQQTIDLGFQPSDLELADVDGDGFADVVTVGARGYGVDGQLAVVLGNGDGTFNDAPSIEGDSSEWFSESISLALSRARRLAGESISIDLNNDGIEDAVSISVNGIHVAIGMGDDSFHPVREIVTGHNTVSLAVGDVNGDGSLDLVTANGASDNVTVVAGIGDGSFTEPQDVQVGPNPVAVDIGDINGDGIEDIVTSNHRPGDVGSVSVLVGDGIGTFDSQIDFARGNRVTSTIDVIAISDVNGDGIADIIDSGGLVLRGRRRTTLRSQHAFARLVNIPQAGAPFVFSTFEGETWWLTTGGMPNEYMLWSHSDECGTRLRRVFNSRPPVALAATETGVLIRSDSSTLLYEPSINLLRHLDNPESTFDEQLPFTTGDGPGSVVLADVNGDGFQDIVTANHYSGNVSVLTGNGDGTFNAKRDVAEGVGATSVVLGDVNGDGINDIVTANGLGDRVNVLTGNGDGTFAPPVDFAAGDGPQSVVLGDMNGDGIEDIVTANSNSDNVSVLIGNGDGTFNDQQLISTGYRPVSVVLGDVNGDGFGDIVTANNYSGNVSILAGNGDGTFNSKQDVAVYNEPFDVVLADINGDGFEDAVTTNPYAFGLSVLIGSQDGITADGKLQFIPYPGDSEEPTDVEIGDIDGDGAVDVVTANFETANVTLFLNINNSDLVPVPGISIESGSRDLVLGDVNGDGITDIVAANMGSDSVSVLIGNASVTSISVGETLFVGNRNSIRFNSEEDDLLSLPISDADSSFGTLRRTRDFEFLRLAEFENKLLATVRLTDNTPRPGELQLLLIDAPQFDDDGNLLVSSVENLTLNSSLRLQDSGSNVVFVDGDRIYLSADLVGEGLGSELFSFDRTSGLQFVGDRVTGSDGSEPADFVATATHVYFTALARRTDNSTRQPVLRREVFELDPTSNSVRAVRAGQAVEGPLSLAGDILFFRSAVNSGETPQLLQYDTNASNSSNDAIPIGAAAASTGNVSGTVFIDRNGDGVQNAGEPGRAGVVIYHDQNNNGRREAVEPFAVTRADDPATPEDETGQYLIFGLPAEEVILREESLSGFTQTSPLEIQGTESELTLVTTVTPGTGQPGLGLPSIVGDQTVYVDHTINSVVIDGQPVDLESFRSAEGLPALQSVGTAHGQNGSTVVFTAVFGTGEQRRELVLNRNNRGEINVIADTATGVTSQVIGAFPSATELTDIEGGRNAGFDSLSVGSTNAAFLATASGIATPQYFAGTDPTSPFARFQTGQLILDGDRAILVERVVEQTGEILSGADLLTPKALLDEQTGGNIGWRIRILNGEEILPLTFFDRIVDVSVSGTTVFFRALEANGNASLFQTSPGAPATRLLTVNTTDFPDGFGAFGALGPVDQPDTSPAVAIDGSNTVLLGGADVPFATPLRDLATGDVDGDGFPDLIVARNGSSDVVVQRGDAEGIFSQTEESYPVGNAGPPVAVAVADRDENGVIDLIVSVSPSTDQVSVFTATSNGNFAAAVNYDLTEGDAPYSVVLGDVNGDGTLDIITANTGSGSVSVLTGNTNGTFQVPIKTSVSVSGRTAFPFFSIATDDINGDGNDDIVVAGSSSNQVSVLASDGSGMFVSPVTYDVSFGPQALTLEDVNGDNIRDIVTANGSSNNVSVLTGNVDGTFNAKQDFAAGDGPFSVVSGDVNGDNIVDIVTANRSSDSVSVLTGNGNGTFNSPVTYDVGTFPEAVSLEDTNDDNVIDIITANGTVGDVTILRGDGTGHFQRFSSRLGLYAQVGDAANTRRIADRQTLNDRNDVQNAVVTDLAISHDAISGGRVVFHASYSNGTQGIYRSDFETKPLARVTVTAGQTVSDVSFGSTVAPGTIRGTSFTDSDVDGVFDAGEVGNAGRTVYLDANLNGQLDNSEIQTTTDANGEFSFTELASETDYVVREVVPEGLAVTVPQTLADATVRLGAAGTVEVVLGSVDSGALGNSADGVVSGVIFDDVDGNGVRADDPNAEPGIPNLTVFVDENGDGILNGGERSSTTTADGSYTIDQLSGTLQAVRVVLPGVTTDQTNPLGNTFTKLTLNTVDSPVEVATGDFNGDGVDDIATTINQVSEVRLFLNNGAGSFAAGPSIQVSGGPGSIAAGSFLGSNGQDGLVVGHRTTSSVKALLLQSDNSFNTVDLITPQDVQAGGQYAGLGNAPYMVTTGDFNADGNDDIAVVSQNALPAGGAVGVFLSDGVGNFNHEQTLTLPRVDADFPTSITAGLVNAGTTVDLVISNLSTANVTILKNSGNAGSSRFSIDQHRPVLGTAPSSVQIGDLDGDGDNEIVTTNLLSNNISVFDNKGNGTFSAANVLTAGQGPAFAELIDIDQNNGLDITFSNSDAGNRFGILRNKGDGTFLAAETSGLGLLSDGTLAFSLVTGQFDDDNGDGVIDATDTPDVVVSNRSGESLNSAAGSLTVGLNTIVPGALSVELPTNTRSASGLNIGLRTINLPPTITDPDDPAPIDEDAGQQTIVLTGITTGGESETLQVSVISDNPDLISPTRTFDSESGTATVRYTPAAEQSGTARVTVTVRDAGIDGSFDAADPDSDDGVVSASFNLVVNAVNDLPRAEADTFGVLLEDGSETLDVLANDNQANPDTGEALTILFASQPASGSVAIVNEGSQLQYTPADGFIGQETFNYIVSDNQFTAQGAVTVNVTSSATPTDLLLVSSLTPNPSGFDVVFSEAFNASLVNLYSTQSLGPADVVVTGASTGSVQGSLIVDGVAGTASFIRTGGPLPADTYTVTLRSGADGFVTTDGDLLDGDSNGTGGDNFTTTFTVAPLSPETVTVSLPDFTRGFGQTVNIPADGTGIPLTLSRGTGISGLRLKLSYDSDLLDITGFVPLLPESFFDFVAETGVLSFSRTSEFTTNAGPLTIGYFEASVPDSAIYREKNPINLLDLQVFSDAKPAAEVPSVSDSALHVVAFPGDEGGNRRYDNTDGTLALRLSSGRIDGLANFRLADPLLLADVTFNGTIGPDDVTDVQRLIARVELPQIPTIPSDILPLPPTGDDPILSIPQSLTGRLGQTITVPVQLEVTEASGITVSGLDVAISYDSTQFSVGNVRVGSLLTDNDLSPFAPFANTATPGQILVTASSSLGTSNLAQNTTGDVFLIDFTVLPTATGGASAINLLASSSGLITGIADNDLSDLVLSPAPSNAGNDSVDGLFTVTTDVTLVERSAGGQLTVRDASASGLGSDLTFTLDGQTLVITESTLPIVAAFGQQVSDQEVRVALADLSTSVVNVLLGAGDDMADGSALTNSVSLNLSGGSGDDTLKGGGGGDSLDGGLGDDDLDGGGGVDSVNVTEDGNLSITTTQTFGQGTDSFSNIEQAVLEGGARNNRLDASAATIPVTLRGLAGNDILLGGSAADVLDGGTGSDFAEIFGGNIVLTDGAAPGTSGEVLIALEGLQLVASVRGSNIDASEYTLGPVTIIGSSGNDNLKGGSGNDLILAGAGRDSIDGGAGSDLIFGRRGRDMINGGSGNDTVFGGGGRDEIDGGTDADVLSGGGGRDTIRGGDGTDFAIGGGGEDSIDGDDGADTLFGGRGRDNIAGGLGADRLNGVNRDDSFNQTVGQDTLLGGQRPSSRPAPTRAAEQQKSAPAPDSFSSREDSTNTLDESGQIDSVFADSILPQLLEL